MCELFGVNSARPVITNDLLQEFFTHCEDHPQGWGIAHLDHGVSLEKEPKKATKSEYLAERLNSTIRARNLLAHIRLATIGNTEYNNCHPFVAYDVTGRAWAQNHNGTLFSAPSVEPFFYRQTGNTDSERMLLYLVDRVNLATEAAGRALTAEERAVLIEEQLAVLTPHNKVNLLLYDGEQLYVHTNYEGSLHVCQDGCTAWFSTLPLTHGDWEPLPLCRLLVYKDGKRIYEGKPHGNEYLDNPEDLKFLENFAML